MIKTASLEPSQRLVALGVVLDTHFKYVKDGDKIRAVSTFEWARHYHHQSITPAPIADELGEVLPEFFHTLKCLDGSYECCSYNVLYDIEDTSGASLADAMCLMLIWLLEQGHITKEEVMKGAKE